MNNKTLKIQYEIYDSIEEMSSEDQELIKAASEAQKTSYAPYSKFNVGAAVRLDNGKIVKGSNQENAASPSGLCAERTAMFSASAQYPDNAMIALAICGGYNFEMDDNPCTPCGSCRQVMAEYQTKGGKNMQIIFAGKKQTWKFAKVEDILPFIFDSLDVK